MKIYKNYFLYSALILGLWLGGCQPANDIQYKKLSKGARKVEKYEGHYKVFNKRKVASKKQDTKAIQTGIGSWYGERLSPSKTTRSTKTLHGKRTANGDIFDVNALTAAHRTLPLPSIAKITNLENNKSIIVMINDRGPYCKNRVIDVSPKVAEYLNFKNKGLAKLRIEPLGDESAALLKKLSLDSAHGSKASNKMQNPKCSVNCFIKLLNIQNGLDKL